MRIPLTLLALTLSAGTVLRADISFSLTIGPPPMPVYAQPAPPDTGFLWEPGYWSWGDEGYFWVPGTWVMAPEPGMLWTPGYWGWDGGSYRFHQGYWGTEVGFYGGINYGYGYGGSGFQGGRWQGRDFYYNRAVTNTGGSRATTVYNQAVTVNNTHVSFNGGQGGVQAAPTRQEQQAAGARHLQPTAEQARHLQLAGRDRQLLASENRGKPPVAATRTVGDFSPRAAVPAREAGGKPDENSLKATPKSLAPAGHPVQAAPGRPVPEPVPIPAHPVPGPVPIPAHPAPGPVPVPVHPAPGPVPVPVRPQAPHAPEPPAPPQAAPRPVPAQPAPPRPQPEPRPEPRPEPQPQHGQPPNPALQPAAAPKHQDDPRRGPGKKPILEP